MKKISRLLFINAMIAVCLFAQAKDNKYKSPVGMTAEQDHQRLMDLLGIDSLRPGPSGDPAAPNYANTDESKASPYTTLPDPLIMNNGEKVTTPEMWWNDRRPEIVEDFDREVYGRVPENTPDVNWEVVSETEDSIKDIPVIKKELIGHVDNSSYPLITVDIQVTLVTPVDVEGPVPVILEFGADYKSFIKDFDESKMPPEFSAWKSQILSKGWGYAILMTTSIQADNGTGLTKGIIGLCNHGQPREVDDWGALRAWAWGAGRVLDYFETDEDVDAKQVGIEGLSRYGKAALVTMAYDQRFAIGFIGSSGAGGAKIHRRVYGEQVENIASSYEYHWMAGNYIKYAGPLTPNDLPVDAHELIALCAPRPVFIGVGAPEVEGYWIDAKGMFIAAVYAEPVYELLGKKGMGIEEMPEMGAAVIDGDIAFRQHFGGHTNVPNWETFLEFASHYLSTKGNK